MTMKPGWDWITSEMESEKVEQIVHEMGASAILAISDVFAIIREKVNDTMLKELAEEHGRCAKCGAKPSGSGCLQCDLGWKAEDIVELERLLLKREVLRGSHPWLQIQFNRNKEIIQRLKELGWTED